MGEILQDKLTVSNLAWKNIETFNKFYEILNEYNISGIEIAPTKIWGRWNKITFKKINKFKTNLEKKNLQTPTMQSLTFGYSDSICNKLYHPMYLKHFEFLIKISEDLDVTNLLFGSPSIRKFYYKSKVENYNSIKIFFNKLSNLLAKKKKNLIIEANPKVYGSDFFNTHNEIYFFLKKMKLKNIFSNLDTGTAIINRESKINKKFIGHLHISAPYLDEITKYKNKLMKIKLKFSKNYTGWKNLELLNLKNIRNLKSNINLFRELVIKN